MQRGGGHDPHGRQLLQHHVSTADEKKYSHIPPEEDQVMAE